MPSPGSDLLLTSLGRRPVRNSSFSDFRFPNEYMQPVGPDFQKQLGILKTHSNPAICFLRCPMQDIRSVALHCNRTGKRHQHCLSCDHTTPARCIPLYKFHGQRDDVIDCGIPSRSHQLPHKPLRRDTERTTRPVFLGTVAQQALSSESHGLPHGQSSLARPAILRRPRRSPRDHHQTPTLPGGRRAAFQRPRSPRAAESWGLTDWGHAVTLSRWKSDGSSLAVKMVSSAAEPPSSSDVKAEGHMTIKFREENVLAKLQIRAFEFGKSLGTIEK